MHHDLPTTDALEAKLLVERDSASTFRDEVDMLRKETSQSQAVLKTAIKYLVDFKMKQAEIDRIVFPSSNNLCVVHVIDQTICFRDHVIIAFCFLVCNFI